MPPPSVGHPNLSQHTNSSSKRPQPADLPPAKPNPSALTCTTVDFNLLTLASLRKYKRVHRLRIKPTVSKAELVQVVTAHFASPEAKLDCVQEGEEKVIDDFVTAVRLKLTQEQGVGSVHLPIVNVLSGNTLNSNGKKGRKGKTEKGKVKKAKRAQRRGSTSSSSASDS